MNPTVLVPLHIHGHHSFQGNYSLINSIINLSYKCYYQGFFQVMWRGGGSWRTIRLNYGIIGFFSVMEKKGFLFLFSFKNV